VNLTSIFEIKENILQTHPGFNFDYGFVKYSFSPGNCKFLEMVEGEIYTILNFDLKFFSPFPTIIQFIEKIGCQEREKIRKLANNIIYDVVTRPLIICYEAQYIAACVVYFAYFIRGFISETTLIEEFVLNNKLLVELDVDVLINCCEDIKAVFVLEKE
jgi:hypothetical protein